MSLQAARAFGSALRRWLGNATEPHFLYPAVALLVLGVIWTATLQLVEVEREAAERRASVSSYELAETYEAQVVRALREIDQALKFVKYSYERRLAAASLDELQSRGLLPPEFLFVVSIADRNGDIVSSTRPLPSTSIAGKDYFQRQLTRGELAVSHPERDARSTDWMLRFTRRLEDASGQFAGVVMISVDAAYFVSAYEPAKLGMSGVLGLVGADGVFRVRRSDDTVTAGAVVDYAAVVAPRTDAAREGTLQISPLDYVRRYTSVRELFDFPLAVVVGLSVDEQLAPSRRDRQAHIWRAFGGSVLLLLVVGILGRMSRQLALSRQQAVDEHVAHAERIEFLAFHDALTTLPNRSMFSKLLGQSLSEALRYGRKIAVLFMDLDRFKTINDTLGHDVGDQLLREVASRLKECLRQSDTVARLGGDEFVVLLPDLDDERYTAFVAQKMLSAVARPFILMGHELRITASVGISIYPQDGQDELELMKNSDIAMYRAKDAGKNNFQFYANALNASSLERRTLEFGLRRALERKEFQLHYQARQDITTGQITGVEALLRWQHPDLGIVAPLQFLTLAEETGLIVPIGKWVLKTACLQHVAWQALGLSRVSIAVNLSARQFFDPGLLRDLESILAETGMAAALLEIEITEGLLMHDVDKTLRIFSRLKEIGVRIAIDDFGIGYASLSAWRQFPLDTLKIDRSFIIDGASVDADRSATGGIIAMGRTLSQTVVVQGVETMEQADFLRQHGFNQCQGFYFGKPVPGDEMARLLRTHSRSPLQVAGPVA